MCRCASITLLGSHPSSDVRAAWKPWWGTSPSCRSLGLVLAQDDSTLKSDRRILFEAAGKYGIRDQLTYHHLRAKQEPMLWIPDAVAWCLAKGGEWPDRVRPLITKTVVVR